VFGARLLQAEALMATGQYGQAVPALQAAGEISEAWLTLDRLDLLRDHVIALGKLGDCHLALGDDDAAEGAYEQALAHGRTLGEGHLIHPWAMLLGDLYADWGRPPEAHERYAEALDAIEALEDAAPGSAQRKLSVVLGRLGDLAQERGDASASTAEPDLGDGTNHVNVATHRAASRTLVRGRGLGAPLRLDHTRRQGPEVSVVRHFHVAH
jgi:tetratricopeptide (TPR) repeat protein